MYSFHTRKIPGVKIWFCHLSPATRAKGIIRRQHISGEDNMFHPKAKSFCGKKIITEIPPIFLLLRQI